MSVARNLPIVGLATAPWDFIGSFPQELLRRVARLGWRTMYSTGPLSVWDRDQPEWKTAPWLGTYDDRDGVIVERRGRLPPRWQGWPAYDRVAFRANGLRMRRELGLSRLQPLIVLLFHPALLPMADALKPCKLVFYKIDAHATQPGWTAELENMLIRAARQAELLIVCAASLQRFLPSDVAASSRVLPTATDAQFIIDQRLTACPPDLASIPRPRIGYVGRLNPKVDFRAIAHSARCHPDWHWVLVGPVVMLDGDSDFRECKDDWEDCKQLSNVHLLGRKEYRDVPAYLHHMDVNTICYRLSAGDWTRTAYPFKLFECLATGRPVVASWSEEMHRHSDVLDIVSTPEEWISALDRAITNGGVGTPDQRLAVALDNTWDKRLILLDQWLEDLTA